MKSILSFLKASPTPRLDLPNMAPATARAFHQNNWSDQSEVQVPPSLNYNITAALTKPGELAS